MANKTLRNKLSNYNRVQRARASRGEHSFRQISGEQFNRMLEVYGEKDTLSLLSARSNRNANILLDSDIPGRENKFFKGDYDVARIISKKALDNQHLMNGLNERDRIIVSDPRLLAEDGDMLDLMSDRIDIAETENEIVNAYEIALGETFSEFSDAYKFFIDCSDEEKYLIATDPDCQIEYIYDEYEVGDRDEAMVMNMTHAISRQQ